MDESSPMSPGRVMNSVVGLESLNSSRNLEAASSKTEALRPTMMIREAEAWAKERAIAKPIPLPPPVMRIVLPAWLREGLVGEMAR